MYVDISWCVSSNLTGTLASEPHAFAGIIINSFSTVIVLPLAKDSSPTPVARTMLLYVTSMHSITNIR